MGRLRSRNKSAPVILPITLTVTEPLVSELQRAPKFLRKQLRCNQRDRPINVCYLIDDLRLGGTETQLLQLIRRLDRAEFSPYLCLLNGTNAASQGLEP